MQEAQPGPHSKLKASLGYVVRLSLITTIISIVVVIVSISIINCLSQIRCYQFRIVFSAIT